MRVVIAEDHALLREGLARILKENGIEVVEAVDNAVDLVNMVNRHNPDLAIIDVRLPPDFRDEGVRAALQLRESNPELAVLIVSAYVEATYAAELLANASRGGIGYLLKDRIGDVDEFIESVNRVADGGTAIDADVVSQLLGTRRSNGPVDALSPREQEVLALMAEGRTNASIAAELIISVGAVEKHAANIFAKLQLPDVNDGGHRRVLAVLAWLSKSS